MTPDSAAGPAAQRETPLAVKLKAQIHQSGPISVGQYMHACLLDPEFGYYKTAPALGRKGDFITAPEISQTFGELIGLWCVAVWQQMGAPKNLQIVELGGGRGTLMADALRAAKLMPAFLDAATVAIVETHPGLRQVQQDALKDCTARIIWPETVTELNTLPTILIANEFVDCLPVEHFVSAPDDEQKWHHRQVGVDRDGHLNFIQAPLLTTPHTPRLDVLEHTLAQFQTPKAGDIVEVRSYLGTELNALGGLVFGKSTTPTCPFAGIFIDYGHTSPGIGETLQAVRNHNSEHPLTSPGEADLTAHVDFAEFAATLKQFGFAIDGPVKQGDFLGRLGINERASKLMAHNPPNALEIETAVARLISPTGMGDQFKVLGLRTPNLAPLPGLSP